MDAKNPFSIEGKVTIVTGGATGIGAAIARQFAAQGAPVLIASRNEGNLRKMRDQIRGAGGICEMTVCDVRESGSCDAMVAEAVRHFGRLDVLINNAGAGFPTTTPKLSPNGWRTIVGINLDGTFSAPRPRPSNLSPKATADVSSTYPRNRGSRVGRICLIMRRPRPG